ncbi:hypothetical protein GCM10009574_018210 [Streptomyces asiaticus]|uniref:4Fe-4S ferredoxin-type domain-containing protein n=2 Tax=Streptomyces rhizosphaericus TaxID=114699 RepID=A0ABN1NTL1_9ACTN
MKITVDEEKCCGAGQCVLIAPEVFDQREEDGASSCCSTPSPPTGSTRPSGRPRVSARRPRSS